MAAAMSVRLYLYPGGDDAIVPSVIARVPFPGVVRQAVQRHLPHAVGQLVVVGHSHAAFAGGDGLVGVEGETGDRRGVFSAPSPGNGVRLALWEPAGRDDRRPGSCAPRPRRPTGDAWWRKHAPRPCPSSARPRAPESRQPLAATDPRASGRRAIARFSAPHRPGPCAASRDRNPPAAGRPPDSEPLRRWRRRSWSARARLARTPNPAIPRPNGARQCRS